MEENRFLYRSANHTVNLNNMRLSNKWCDVIIKVGQREFPAHKVILAANLKYFNTMLSNDSFRESKQDVIPMEDIDGEDLEVFVSYAYTGEILLTDSNALSLLEFANYLGEDDIKDACIEFLKKHLKAEQAYCRIFKLATAIDCLSLKSVARTKILSNFEICSQTTDFLNFDYEDLINIFAVAKGHPIEAQQKFFEGIMKWIMHDVKERKNWMNDLLKLINIGNLAADFLIGHLFGNVVDYKDEYNITKDIMAYYHSNKSQEKKKTLTIVSFSNRKLKFQFCNIAKNQWSSLEEIPNVHNNVFSTSAVLNDELYHISENTQNKCINIFNPTMRRSSVLHSSSDILSNSALCACNKYLYLCGGETNGSFISNQALKYDPLTNLLETLAPMKNQRSNAAAIFYQDCLHVLGGWNETSRVATVEKYDHDTNMWMEFPSMCQARSSHAVAVLDGKLYACGGFTRSVEVYDPLEKSWKLVASMREERHTFVVVVHEGKLLAIGGDDEGTVEVYDPLINRWQTNPELSSGLQILRLAGGFISSNSTANANATSDPITSEL